MIEFLSIVESEITIKVKETGYPGQLITTELVKEEKAMDFFERIMNIYWYRVGKNKTDYGG